MTSREFARLRVGSILIYGPARYLVLNIKYDGFVLSATFSSPSEHFSRFYSTIVMRDTTPEKIIF